MEGVEQQRPPRHIGTVEECEFGRMKEPFLTTGYRIGYDFQASLESIFEWHNETMNIWTHGLGFLMVVSFIIYTYKRVVPSQGRAHKILPLLFLLPSLGSMTISTLFHVFRSINERIYASMAPFDFLFIALVIVGMQVPLIYYSMYERPSTRKKYLIALFLMLVGAVTYVAIPWLILPALRVLRTGIFVVLAVCALIARVHASVTAKEFPDAARRTRRTLPAVLIAYTLAAISVVVYLFRFPERYYPGTYDNTLQSHILMHLLSMAAEVLFWYTMIVDIREVTSNEPKEKKKTN